MNRFANIVRYMPYFLFLLLVLVPVGAMAYGLASVGRAAYSNFRQGWRDHS